MGDKWEDGFDSWTPRGGGDAGADTDVDLDREQLLRLARELAERRRAEQAAVGSELEQLKQALRERAEAIAARERELAELERKGGKPAPRTPDVDMEALVARERGALERAQALDARERELQTRAAELDAEMEELARREQALEAELERARAELQASQSERELASAEREQLERRSEEARRVEKELAARRIELEQLLARAAEQRPA